MKFTRLFFSLFVLTLWLTVSAWGQRNWIQLDNPQGLAVDASGNIYVANGNVVLVYSFAYQQQLDKLIAYNVNAASGVAIDPYGNVWVSNYGGDNITEYIAGVQNASATISKSIETPTALAIDGLDNLWVLNNSGYVTIYSPTTVYAPPSNLVQSIPLDKAAGGFTVGAGAFLFGTSSQVFMESASATLLGNPLTGGAIGLGATALAPDNSGNIYGANGSNAFMILPDGTATTFVTLPYSTPTGGIAVDNARKRVYFSNTWGNQILVYSKAGVLLQTIKNKN
jgi:hypothetical protein